MTAFKKNLDYIIIAVGVVFVWRGIWGLSDLFLFPNNETLSFICSIAIGIVILFLHDLKKHDLRELL